MSEKRCSRCGAVKSINDFYPHKHHKDGLRSRCKACEKECVENWYRAHKKERRAAAARWRKANHKRHLEGVARCRKAKPDKYRAIDQKSAAKRLKTLKGNLNLRMSRAFRRSLNGQKGGRPWESLVSYSLDDLINHLERHFLLGMTWENYGEWHVDHKIPMAVFNFEKPEDVDFKRCWALSNLCPLWAKDNLKKGDRINSPFQPSLLI